MDTLKQAFQTASDWVEQNPTNTVYIAAIFGGFALLTALSGGGRR